MTAPTDVTTATGPGTPADVGPLNGRSAPTDVSPRAGVTAPTGRARPGRRGGARVVVAGYGMAGARFAAELRAREPDLTVTVFGAEPERAYNRILLSQVLAGKVGEPDVALVEVAERGVDVHIGTEVVAVDRAARRVTVRDRHGLAQVGYDHLVLATGSRAVVPPLAGLTGPAGPAGVARPAGVDGPAGPAGGDGAADRNGPPAGAAGARLPERVAVFRTLADCRRILAAARRARGALVLGGGLLGLEAARGLAGRGIAVDVVHPVGHLMERQLDPGASAVLVDTLTRLGITTHLESAATAVAADPAGVRLTLADGRELAADLLVVACGVRPETTLATAAGLAVRRGIVVDDRLRTSDPAISAIGDCAEHGETVSGLVAPAWEQARVLADVLAGDPAARYRPLPTVTRLKADGIDLAAMGSLDAGTEQLTFADPVRGTYARLSIEADRLAGAVLLGDNPAVGAVIQLFDRGAPVPADRRSLLLGRATGAPVAATGSPALIPDAATICQCNTVRKGDLVACWRAGADTVEAMAAATRATTGCGSCRDAVAGIVDWLARTDTTTRPQRGGAVPHRSTVEVNR
jgi:assimilatory nitrate reductase electron transfer subunit